MESSKNKQNNRTVLKWIFKRTKKYLPMVFLIAFGSVITALSTIYLALLSKNLLDIVTGDSEGSFLKTSLLLFLVVGVEVLLIGFDTIMKAYATGKLTISMRDYLFRIISRRKYSDISLYHSGDLLNRLTSDNDVVVSNVVGVIPSFTSMIAKIIGGISTMLVLDPKIALIILSFGVLVPALGRIINRKYKELHKKCQKTEGEVRSFVQECFENIVVMKIFEGEDSLSGKLGKLLKNNFRLKMKRSTISLVTHLCLYTFFTAGYYAVMVWGANNIAAGVITYGTLMAFLQLVQQLRAPMQNISGIVPQYYSTIASAERLMEIESGDYDLAPAEKEKIETVKREFSGISVRNISFGYKDELILKNCSFEVPKGQITAITGESGSGKSTIFKIILNLYTPSEGEIIVNDNIKVDTSLRGIMSYVPQGNMVLSGSIRENITLCNDAISDEDIIKAAKAAEIYDYIESLPEGLDTKLSERGAGLSEGQIQRIAIARAFLTDAPLLLLDEATSALDEATETKVLNNIKAMSDKTVLFVTHRNTSLKACDRIVHVENKIFKLIKE